MNIILILTNDICGTDKSLFEGIALSGLALNMNPLAQGFVSLRPELLHYGALPLGN